MGAGIRFRIRSQRGISLTSIVFLLVIFGSLLVLGLRIVPVVSEYMSAKNAVIHAKAAGGSAAEMRKAFDKDALVNDIETLSGKDLDITREGDENQIAFEYERRIPLVANAMLLLKFDYSTDPASTGPSKTAAAAK
jgi:hypothetical protein